MLASTSSQVNSFKNLHEDRLHIRHSTQQGRVLRLPLSPFDSHHEAGQLDNTDVDEEECEAMIDLGVLGLRPKDH